MVKNISTKIILSIVCLSVIFAVLFWGGIFSLTDSFNFEWLVFSVLVAIIIAGTYHLIFRYLAAKYDYTHEYEFIKNGALISIVAVLLHFPIVIISREQLRDTYAKKYITKNYDYQKEGYIYFLGNILFLLFLTILLFVQQYSFFLYAFLAGITFAFWQICPLFSLSYIKIKAMKTPYLWLLLLYFLWLIVLLSGLFINWIAIFIFLILILIILYLFYYKIPNL